MSNTGKKIPDVRHINVNIDIKAYSTKFTHKKDVLI